MQSCFEFLICISFISLFYSYFCVKKVGPVEMLTSPCVQFAVRTVQYRQKYYLLHLYSLQYVRYSISRNVNFSLCLVCSMYCTVPVEMLPSPSVQFAVRTVQYRQKCYLLLLSSLQYVRYSTGRNVTFSFCPVCSTYGTVPVEMLPSPSVQYAVRTVQLNQDRQLF